MPTKRTLTILISVIVTAISLLAADQYFESADSGRFMLAASTGKELLNQCSRRTPRGVSGFWQPSIDDINELERALPDYLAAREKGGQEIPPKKQAYHRQYVGFTRGTERFIYGNFYPASAATAAYWKDKESKEALEVCDGGPAFWGIVFRISTKKFEEISFNGLG